MMRTPNMVPGRRCLAIILACIAGGYIGFVVGFIVLSVDAAWKGILQPGYEAQWGIFAGIFYACIAGAVGGVIGISRFRVYLGWLGFGALLKLQFLSPWRRSSAERLDTESSFSLNGGSTHLKNVASAILASRQNRLGKDGTSAPGTRVCQISTYCEARPGRERTSNGQPARSWGCFTAKPL